MLNLTRQEVQVLNRHAWNTTQLVMLDTVDYGYWRYIPQQGNPGDANFEEGYFTDGHDYAGHPPEPPLNGWEIKDHPVEISPAKLLEAIRALERASANTRALADETPRETCQQFAQIIQYQISEAVKALT